MARHCYSAFEVGDETESQVTIGPAHMVAASELFGDHHPIHTDDAYAQEKGHPSAMLAGSIISGAMTGALAEMLAEAGLALLSFSVRYRAPVYRGDILTSRCRVVGMEEKPHRGGGLIFLEVTLHNQDGTLIAEAEAVDLVEEKASRRKERVDA